MSHLDEFDNWFEKLWTDTICSEYRNGIVEREADIVASLYHHVRSRNERWGLRCQAKAADLAKEKKHLPDHLPELVCDLEYKEWRRKASSRRIDLEVRLPDDTLIPIEVKTFWQRGIKGMAKDLENLWFRLENPHTNVNVAACYYCTLGYGGLRREDRFPEGKFYVRRIKNLSGRLENKWMRGVLRFAHGSDMERHEWGCFKVR